MKKINLLVIEPYCFLPGIYGGKKAIEQLYSHLGKLVALTIVSVKSNDEAFAKHFTLIKLFSDNRLRYINVFYFFKLKNLISRLQITHVIIEHPYMGWLGFLLQKTTGIKFIVRSQNIEAIRFKTFGKWWWKGMWYYERWVHQKADANFFITSEDEDFALKHYKLVKQKCSVITYGIDRQAAPLPGARFEAKNNVCNRHHIPLTHVILLFNGDLAYAPNEQAVKAIIEHINPLLIQKNFQYSLVICGRNLADQLIKQIEEASIIYTGFVSDINEYFLAADIFINPVITGGGIKTKLVEALSLNCNAVSTASGATGMPLPVMNDKLKITPDNDWPSFVNAILQSNPTQNISPLFYQYFYWGNIAAKALQTLQNTLP